MRLALDGTKKNCYTAVIDGDKLTVPIIFAVGNLPTAVLLRAVKGGVPLPQTKYLQFYRYQSAFFLYNVFSYVI